MKTYLTLFGLCLLLIAQPMHAQAEKILFVGGQHSNKAKINQLRQMLAGDTLSIDQHNAGDIKDLNEAAGLFAQYDLVILDAVSENSSKTTYMKYAPVIAQIGSRVLPIKWPEGVVLRRGISEAQARTLFDYYDNGGAQNLQNMLLYLQHRVFAKDTLAVAEPVIFPAAGIYHPDYARLVFENSREYLAWRGQLKSNREAGNKPMIGLLMHRAAIEAMETGVIDTTIRAFEARGAVVVPFFFGSSRAAEYGPILDAQQRSVVDIIVNFRSIHQANLRKTEFEQLGVPVVQALTYYEGNQSVWEQDPQGIPANSMAFTLALPETAGVIDPMLIAARDKTTHEVAVIDYQLQHLVDRVMAYANLKYKPNVEKQITVMVWGDKAVGASFLNVPDSLRAIAARLNQEGYAIDAVSSDYFTQRVDRILDPFYRDYELDALLKDDLADLFPLEEYRRWLSQLPSGVVAPVNEFWGDPEDNFMVVERNGEKYFVIPRMRVGNMLVMRQPPRGDDKDQDKSLYHTKTVPMNHYYLAAYMYARRQSDAFIHLGTHGSHEYLPGKERGLSRFDPGNLTVGNVPVMYPFIVDDIGEAMQTKRRGNAVVISHMTPPYAAAGLQGKSADLHELMHQYRSLDPGGVKQKTGTQIVEICQAESFCEDIGWNDTKINADFDGFLAALHSYMEDVASENQPLGLHSLGELPERRLIASTLIQMLGREFMVLAAAHERDMDEGGDHDHEAASYDRHNVIFKPTDTDVESIPGFRTIEHYVLEQNSSEHLDAELATMIEQGREYYNRMAGIREMDNLVAGLNGRYVPVKTGGDPVRHPESLPTGSNLYGFDPSRLPTKAAYEQGRELVEATIANYYQQHGGYPDKLAFSLWSIEAMRHYGVLESQALYAMGARPVWSKDGRVVDTEIIPASELKRPRIDVVLSATGLYRDAFPNVMLRLAGAIQQLSQLKEEGNSIWENSERIRAELLAEGHAEDEAEYLSGVRIFSSMPGNYGSGTGGPVFNSDTWDQDSKISDAYLGRMGFAFGADSSRWAEESPHLYAKQLSGTDIAMFSRSSNLYGLLSSDDPFQYFGSLALAVRNLDGASPQMMISNLRDVKNARIENAAEFISRELRTRNFNKRWISEMQKEGYSGAETLASQLANFWGWQVVDPNLVKDHQWQEFYEVYVEDKLQLDIDEWFEKIQPAAQARMIEQMLEANRKQYWQADAETLKRMIQRYQELVTGYDLFQENSQLNEFINSKASGFGLQPLPMNADSAMAQSVNQPVEGQKLEKVTAEQNDRSWDEALITALSMTLLLFLVGALRQATRLQPV